MQNYTVKLILWTHNPNKDGLFPIYLKATINRKTTYKATGHFTKENLWDAKNEQIKFGPALVNARLSKLKMEWETKIISEQLKGSDLSSAQIKESFKINNNNLFEFVDQFIQSQQAKKSKGTLLNYKKHLSKLETFVGSRLLSFESVDVSFLRNYEAWLRDNINFRKEDEQKNYIHAIWKTLKTWFNAARRQELINTYPFDRYDNPVYVSPEKDFLNFEELRSIEKFCDENKDPVLFETAVYFLFGCYSGLRISDWYQFNFKKHIHNDKLRLRPAKTKNKWVEMIVSKPLARNLKRMQAISLQLKEATINEKLKIIATKCSLNKHLTSHTGRHTFAVTLCLGNKISSETAAELMGITLSTFVKNYSQVTQSKIDAETKQAWKKLK